jgi:hypothetical protein
MKKIVYIYVFLLSAFSTSLWTGCKEKDAEAVPPAENLKAYAGKYRAKLEFTTPTDARSVKVFYGVGKYRELPLADAGNEQSLIVEELPEGEQILRVAMLNDAGTLSDPKGVKVNVYGESYQSSLRPRRLTEQNVLSPTSVEFRFGEAAESETELWIVFVNTSGSSDSVKISAEQASVMVTRINTNEPYYYYSVFQPEPDAMDKFYSMRMNAQNAIMLDFEKEKWTIAGFSDEEPGGGGWALASYIIDNNVTTYWHSQVNGVSVPMPHWIAVDMQSEKIFDGFYFVQTQLMDETGLAKRFRFEISSDNSQWTTVLEGEFTTSRARQEFSFPQQVTARYFKITILNGYNNAWWSQFAEIDLYNELNVSGLNGSITINALVNAKRPFQGENVLWGDRMYQLVGWTHNPYNIISFATDFETTMIMFSIPAGGVSYVTNGKVYQTVTLQPGSYTLAFDCGNLDANAGVLAYGVITAAETLPDITTVTTDGQVLGYAELSAVPNSIHRIPFTLSGASSVTIGWVYNTFDNGQVAWSAFYMNGIELYRN